MDRRAAERAAVGDRSLRRMADGSGSQVDSAQASPGANLGGWLPTWRPRRERVPRRAPGASVLARTTRRGRNLFVRERAGATAPLPPLLRRRSRRLRALVFRYASWTEGRSGELPPNRDDHGASWRGLHVSLR